MSFDPCQHKGRSENALEESGCHASFNNPTSPKNGHRLRLMKYRGHDAKRDLNEKQIVKDLVKVGAKVKRLTKPCDLLVRFRFRLFLIEVSNPDYPHRKRDEDQLEFLKDWNVPEVRNSEEALRVIGFYD